MGASLWRPELPPGRLLTVPGMGRVFVRDLAGPEGAPVVLLLHGWTATADLNWYPAYAALAERYRVVAFDHRGHGRGLRTRKRFRLEDCADDAVAVADALGIDQFVPVGYSMGGPIASLIWRRNPERVQGLVLCATASRFGTTRLVRAELALFHPLALSSRVLPRRVAKPVYGRVVAARTRSGNLQPWAIDQILSGEPRQVLEAGAALQRFDSRDWIQAVDVPAAVVIVDGDDIVPTPAQDDLAERIPGAHVVRVRGAHDVCVRHPRRFLAALDDALSSVTTDERRSPPIDAETGAPTP
jgi:3-oxoadipate enol-lactonase